MTVTTRNQDTSHSTVAAIKAVGTPPQLNGSTEVHAAAAGFLTEWTSAWNARDARALASLHTGDCVTINRYGTLLPDRHSAEEALSFLLGPHGPFADTIFQPMNLVGARQIFPGVVILQARWSAPALGPNGRTIPDQFNQMMLSYTLIEQEGRWKTTQIDGHNVEHMELPFSSPEQKT